MRIGTRLIAVAATLASLAVLGAALVVTLSYVAPENEASQSVALSLLWWVALSLMHAPKLIWAPLLVLTLLTPRLLPFGTFAFAGAGAVLALPLVLFGDVSLIWQTAFLVFGIGALAGALYARLLHMRFTP